ncbi:MAG: aldehyde dehydrogenase family protein [Gammaproteobacteria bacterium]
MRVRNPYTGDDDYSFEPCTPEQIRRAVQRARDAQPQWLDLGVAGRVAALREFATVLERRAPEFVAALRQDTGRVAESTMEVNAVVDAITHWCERAPVLLEPGGAVATRVPFVEATLGATPYSVAGIISPWNFPLLLSFIDAIPGLLAGCAIVLKPSEVTPRFVDPLREALEQVPALDSVFRIIRGAGDVGEVLVSSVDLVCFTGSVATGKRVAIAAAQAFIPAHLELGGKDPALVFADADIERAAAAVTWGSMANAGQSCLSIERVYVQRDVHDQFVELLVENVAALELNDAQMDVGDVGPFISDAQADIVERHLEDAAQRGAKMACGGKLRRAGGVWCEPTVVTAVDHDMRIMREETFGPVVAVMAFDSEQEAIALANDTQFGLSAAVFSGDTQRLHRVASQLAAGAVSANDVGLTSFIHEGAKQAFKFSGLGGSRMGDSALARFYRARVVLANIDEAWDPWWYNQPSGGQI